MTCIVGIKDKESHRVVIGGDSAASVGRSHNLRKDPKVFKNGDFLILNQWKKINFIEQLTDILIYRLFKR